jgi:predicted nucleic acid-binding protein
VVYFKQAIHSAIGMKLRIYLDTSVLSAYWDERAPERMADTREFWGRLSEFEASTSDLVRSEIARTPNAQHRARLASLADDTANVVVSEDARELAAEYVRRGLFAPEMYDDALHVAVAVLSRQDAIVSWNFRHLVNRRKRAQVNEVNVVLGLPMVEILAPSEL